MPIPKPVVPPRATLKHNVEHHLQGSHGHLSLLSVRPDGSLTSGAYNPFPVGYQFAMTQSAPQGGYRLGLRDLINYLRGR